MEIKLNLEEITWATRSDTSFPFLRIAKLTGAAYGDVIRVAEAYANMHSRLWDEITLQSHRNLSIPQRNMVFDAMVAEQLRRRINEE